ncbi:MAG: hypothetical protein AAGA80_26280 [Cyanobacteria bacterium P01_F01_bin.143]
MSFIDNLLPYIGTSKKVFSFISGGSFQVALNAIGSVHLSAAEDVIKKIEFSSDPREAVNRVLSCLEITHISLNRTWNSKILSNLLIADAGIAALKDTQVCCLIAMCHKYLGDDKKIIMQAIHDAQKALAFYQQSLKTQTGLLGTIKEIFYGSTLYNPIKSIYALHTMERISQEDLDKFSKKILLI